MFVLEIVWIEKFVGTVWIESLFLDFGRIEKMVVWASIGGGIVYQKKKKKKKKRWWYEDGGVI